MELIPKLRITGSVAKIIFLHFDTIIFTFMWYFLSNEND